jgi:transposase
MSLEFDQKNSTVFDPTKLSMVVTELARPQLEAIVLQQAALIQELQARLLQLEKKIEELADQPPTSTAPFRLPPHKRVTTRKKPGQKKGHPGNFRQASTPTEIIEVPLEYCPDCFAPVEHLKNHTQTIEELPVILPQVIQIKTQSGVCQKCKKKLRSSHPWQISKAKGAASTMLGPQATALALELNTRFHLTKAKTCAVLKEFFGLHLTRGGLVNLSHRIAAKLQPAFASLQREVQHSSHIHADETGWYVAAPGYSLCVFTNQALTLYHITKAKTSALIKQILGNYQGVLISDCLSIYDSVNARQQKCYAHHLKAIKEAGQKIPTGVSTYLAEVKLLLQTAMVVKTLQAELPAQEFQQRLRHLEVWADKLLLAEKRPEPLPPAEESVRQRLGKQRDHLFEFLKHKEVEATNNQAERQLRPAVIARKLSCGNRTEKGARTWEILQSLAVTSHQRNQSFKDLITASIFRLPP